MQSKQYYQDALTKSGHTYELKYNPSAENRSENTRRKRQRKIIWFNPPYSKIVASNIGKKFLSLLDKHFPRNHKFHKIFNRNNVKVSYGCMPNIKAVINAHNKDILEEKIPLARGKCNCNNKSECPLNGECTTNCVLYEATIESNLRGHTAKVYKGITAPIFKSRYGNHKKSFNNTKYRDDSTLSKEVWKIKDKGGDYRIKWKIMKQYPAYNPANKKCSLCLNEKLAILEHRDDNLLNKRSEIVSTCRHKNNYMLKYLTSREDNT